MSRHPDWPKRWRVWKDQGDWFVISPEYAERHFPTHAEALAYADRMARTREYVLPRPSADGYITTTDEQIALEGTGYDHYTHTYAWIEEPGTIGLAIGDSNHYMTAEGAHSIALALAALAEQEEHE